MKTNELYASAPVRTALGPALRPGGTELTRRLLEYASPQPDSVVLDAGCGCGATMKLLAQFDVRGIGLDTNAFFLHEVASGHVAQADLAHLPLPGGCLDLIICECVWNLTDKIRVLKEFFRVLHPGGMLALTDIFARGKNNAEWPVRCCFAQATDLDTVMDQVESAGFRIEIVEDHSPLLAHAAADFVFRHGSLHGFWQAVTGDDGLAKAACTASRSARPGLFLLMARRS